MPRSTFSAGIPVSGIRESGINNINLCVEFLMERERVVIIYLFVKRVTSANGSNWNGKWPANCMKSFCKLEHKDWK